MATKLMAETSVLNILLPEAAEMTETPTITTLAVKSNQPKSSSLDNSTTTLLLNPFKKLSLASAALLTVSESSAVKTAQAEALDMSNSTLLKKLKKLSNTTDTKLMADQSNSTLPKTDPNVISVVVAAAEAAVVAEEDLAVEEVDVVDSVEAEEETVVEEADLAVAEEDVVDSVEAEAVTVADEADLAVDEVEVVSEEEETLDLLAKKPLSN